MPCPSKRVPTSIMNCPTPLASLNEYVATKSTEDTLCVCITELSLELRPGVPDWFPGAVCFDRPSSRTARLESRTTVSPLLQVVVDIQHSRRYRLVRVCFQL